MLPYTKIEWKRELQFLTPCFCTGGDQDKPELRVPTLRGELRWWVRCLGASRKQEWALFGGPVKESSAGALASAFAMRAKMLHVSNEPWVPHNKVDRMLHEQKGYFRTNSTFEVQLLQIRPVEDLKALRILELAWRCFCSLGSIGCRKTRGYGAVSPVHAEIDDVEQLLKDINKHFRYAIKNLQPGRSENIIKRIGELVQDKRKSGFPHDIPTVMGYVHMGSSIRSGAPDRQMSAVRYRPIRKTDGSLALLILQAPDFTLHPIAAANSRDFKL